MLLYAKLWVADTKIVKQNGSCFKWVARFFDNLKVTFFIFLYLLKFDIYVDL
jgi:hypothetical protein